MLLSRLLKRRMTIKSLAFFVSDTFLVYFICHIKNGRIIRCGHFQNLMSLEDLMLSKTQSTLRLKAFYEQLLQPL